MSTSMKHSSNKPTIIDNQIGYSMTPFGGKFNVVIATYARRYKSGHQITPDDIINLIHKFYGPSKRALSVVMVGAYQSGKSTLATQLLRATNAIDDRTLYKYQKKAKELNHDQEISSKKYSIFMDRDETAKQTGITIEGSCIHSFCTESYEYTLLDTPGHQKYIKNAIRYISLADIAICVVPMNKEFETSIQKPIHKKCIIEGGTRVFLRLCLISGVKDIVIAFNKIDQIQPDKAQTRFDECKLRITKILTNIGFPVKKIAFVPISGYEGVNIKDMNYTQDYIKWYQGFEVRRNKRKLYGFTIFDALDYAKGSKLKCTETKFRMSVCKMFKKDNYNHRYIFRGKIFSGSVKVGDRVKLCLTEQTFIVDSIQYNYINTETATQGLMVSINARQIRKSPHGRRYGDFEPLTTAIDTAQLMCLDEATEIPKYVTSFTAMVFVVNHPGKLNKTYGNMNYWKKPINGYCPIVFISTWRCSCRIMDIVWKSGKSTNNIKTEQNGRYGMIEQGDSAEVIFRPITRLNAFCYDEIEKYGRITVYDDYKLVLMGKILSVECG